MRKGGSERTAMFTGDFYFENDYLWVPILMAVAFCHVAFSYLFAECAGRISGGFRYWFGRFLLLPLAEHAVFAIGWIYQHHNQKARRRRKDFYYLELRARHLGQIATAPGRTSGAITPFDSPETSGTAYRASRESVLRDWRDGRIEDLMRWEQWNVAYALAEDRLTRARQAQDAVSIELYEAYIDRLRPMLLQVPHSSR